MSIAEITAERVSAGIAQRVTLVDAISFHHGHAVATARAAVTLCGLGALYAHHGRGPDHFDDIGLTRAALQAGADFHAYARGAALGPALADFTGYPESQGWNHPKPLFDILRAWGLEPHSGTVNSLNFPLQVGDVVVYAGRGPGLGIVVRVRPGAPATVVMADQQRGIHACSQVRFNLTPVGVWRWPAAPSPEKDPTHV